MKTIYTKQLDSGVLEVIDYEPARKDKGKDAFHIFVNLGEKLGNSFVCHIDTIDEIKHIDTLDKVYKFMETKPNGTITPASLKVGAVYMHKSFSLTNGTTFEYTGETVRKHDSSVSQCCDPKHEPVYKTHYAFKPSNRDGLQWFEEYEMKELTLVK